MDLSIIIVNWNTQALLRACLNSLRDRLGPLEVEVLVVDNASSDASCAMLRAEYPWVELIESPENLGFAGGNNLALPRAKGRYVLLLNTDTLVHGDVLADAIAWLDQHPQVGVMGPRLLNADRTIQPSCSSFPSLGRLAMQTLGLTRIKRFDTYRFTGWQHDTVRHVDVISGAAMFVRRRAMEQVGLLDDAFFFYGEETDWCRRFADAGWQLAFVPLRDITHLGNGAAATLNHRRDVLMTQGTTRLHLKHGGPSAAALCFLILSAHNLSRALFWTCASLTGRSRTQARARAAHFAKVVRDLPKAWPRTSVEAPR